jgi:hypothetical protein
MAPDPESPLSQLLEDQRRAKSLRQDSSGPICAAAEMVRESCATTRLILDELESAVGSHLDVLDALLRRRFGNQWWNQLGCEAEAREGVD